MLFGTDTPMDMAGPGGFHATSLQSVEESGASCVVFGVCRGAVGVLGIGGYMDGYAAAGASLQSVEESGASSFLVFEVLIWVRCCWGTRGTNRSPTTKTGLCLSVCSRTRRARLSYMYKRMHNA